MRRRTCVNAALLCSLAATAAVPATASAATNPAAHHPVHNDGLTVAATPNNILSGTGLVIYGQLKGSDVAYQPVHLYHRIGAAPQFSYVGTTKTNQYGFYEFTRAEGVVTTNRNWYVEGPNGTHSNTFHERVASIVSLAESATSSFTNQTVDFTGSVSPNHPDQTIDIQEQGSVGGAAWKTIARGRTNGSSAFSIGTKLRVAGDYTLRAYLPGDADNTPGSSDSVTLAVQQNENPSFTITSSVNPLTVGQGTTISGTEYAPGSTTTPEADAPVNLYARTAGGKFTEIGTGVTDGTGVYMFNEAPVNNTAYVVESANSTTTHSAAYYEAVADTVSMTPSSTSVAAGAPVTFSGTVTPSHVGHNIVLQEETAKGWQTVAQGVVGAGSDYTLGHDFGQPGTYSVRTRIFGGPLNVGAASAPVTITVSGYAAASSLPAS